MGILVMIIQLLGGLCLFLFGMRVMSDGMQQATGERMQKALNFVTQNRFIAVLTGFVITVVVQSSSASTVMVVSFVNAGLLNLTQAIGVIMGANIGTTTTAWFVSLIGYKVDMANLALPAIGIGFIMRTIKWKHQEMGEAFLGFGFIFLGLEFMSSSLPTVNPESLAFIQRISQYGMLSVIMCVVVGTGVT